MTFREAIRTCFRKYVDFGGRAGRSEYWWFYLFRFLLSIPLTIFMMVAFVVLFIPLWTQAASGNPSDVAAGDLYWGPIIVGLVLTFVAGLALFLPGLAVEARRLHDAGYPGALVLLNFVFLGIVPLIMCIFPSVPGPNEHGPAPA